MKYRVYNRYPEEWEEWLKANYSSPTLEEDFCKEFGVHKTLQQLRVKGRALGLKVKHTLSNKELNWLKDNYPKCKSTSKLTEEFNKLFKANYNRKNITLICSKNGIKKEIRSNCESRRHPLGYEIVDSRGRVFVKYRDYYPKGRKYHGMQNYMPKSRYMYEKYHNCKLTSEDKIIFLDGNNRNFNKNNLECVSNEELGSIQGYGWVGNKKITKAGIELLRAEKLIEDME